MPRSIGLMELSRLLRREIGVLRIGGVGGWGREWVGGRRRSSFLSFFGSLRMASLFFSLPPLSRSLSLPLSVQLQSLNTKPLTCAARRRSSGTRWAASRGAGLARKKKRKKMRKKTMPPPKKKQQTRHRSPSARRSVVFDFEFGNWEQEEESLSANGVKKQTAARKQEEPGSGKKGAFLSDTKRMVFFFNAFFSFFSLADTARFRARSRLCCASNAAQLCTYRRCWDRHTRS